MKDHDCTMEEKLTIVYEYIREETTSLVAKDLSEGELQHLIDYRFGRFLRLLYIEKDAKS